MLSKISGGFVRDVMIGLVVAIGGAVMIKYADLPTRVAVVESQTADVKSAVLSIDHKLDILIQRHGNR